MGYKERSILRSIRLRVGHGDYRDIYGLSCMCYTSNPARRGKMNISEMTQILSVKVYCDKTGS